VVDLGTPTRSEAPSLAPAAPELKGPRTVAARFKINQRTIQIALGCVWILDAMLQYQPKMFGGELVTQMILPMAQHQPTPVAWSITTLAHFVRPDVGVWNFLFGTLQLTIGVGLLRRRTVKPAIVLSIVWAVFVWWFGEGFGMLLTGTASPLTGAPGAVLLYAVIAMLVWPNDRAPADDAVGVASSAAASGPFGVTAALAVWAVFWVGSAVLWLMPASRGQGSLSALISAASSGQPGWYAHLLTHLASGMSGTGTELPWIIALASIAIGVGPLFSRRPAPFLVAGAVLQVSFWVSGQGLGGMFTGMGTDPNVGPLVVLLTLATLPVVVPERMDAPLPARTFAARNPLAIGGAAAAAVAVLLLSATYPVAATGMAAATSATTSDSSTSAQRGSSMAGMPGMSDSVSLAAASPSAGVAKDPSSSMDMSGMAGLGVRDPNWAYTGPALPAAQISLLTDVGNATDQGHAMQTAACTAAPTATQTLGAVQYVQATTAAVAKYQVLRAAVAAGYIPVTSTAYPVVHYVNLSYMRDQYALDPNHVDSLVYAFTPNGPVLVAAMHLMPRADELGPMPYGCLIQWHAHTNLCTSVTTHQIVALAPCPPGTTADPPTPMMTHVWQVPVPGGPLAMDPSDLQVVESAIMAQRQGLSPVTAPDGTPTYNQAG
jgi:hypothetical protein